MAKSKQEHSFQTSIAAHKKLRKRAKQKGGDFLSAYHDVCIRNQYAVGRVLTCAERKKVYDTLAQHW